MSRLWWKDEAGEQASAEAVQGLSPGKRKERPDPPPPTQEERERVKVSLQLVKDALNPLNPAQEAARKERQAVIDGERAARDEHTRRMEYLVRGFEPVPTIGGKTLAFSLARSIGVKLTPRKPAPTPNDGFLLPAEDEQ